MKTVTESISEGKGWLAIRVPSWIFGGGAIALAAFTYQWGKDVNGGVIDYLTLEKQSLEQKLLEAQGESKSMAQEIVRLRAGSEAHASKTVPIREIETPIQPSKNKPTVGNEHKRIEIPLNTGESSIVMDGKLTISLVRVDYSGTPLAYRVTAVLGLEGQPVKQIDDAIVGTVVTYQGYEVRLIGVGALRALFLVRSIDPVG